MKKNKPYLQQMAKQLRGLDEVETGVKESWQKIKDTSSKVSSKLNYNWRLS